MPKDIHGMLANQKHFEYYPIEVKPRASFRMTDIITGTEQSSPKHAGAFHVLPCRSLPDKFLPTVLRAVSVSCFKSTACCAKPDFKASSPGFEASSSCPAVLQKYDGCYEDYDIIDDLDFF